MRELTICTDAESGKGRSFRGALLAYAESKSLWEQGAHENTRPIWAMIGCSEAESIPFIRNLQSGRKASIGEAPSSYRRRGATEQFECLRSADYEWHAQRHPEGVVWTVFLPSLYRIDSGMVDPAGVRFAIAPRAEWLSEIDEATAAMLAHAYREQDRSWRVEEEHAKRLAVARYVTRVAPLFAAYLDRRTRCPLIPEPTFYALVLAAMLDAGQATIGCSDREWGRTGPYYQEYDVEDVGLTTGIACSVVHEHLEPLLAKCVKTYEALGETTMRKAA